jgi:hypothetical protein
LPNSSEETFLLPDGFLTELDPQVRLLTLPNFGVNICSFNYGIKVILFRNWLRHQHLQIESVQHLFSLFAIRRSLRLDPNPRSPCPELKSSTAGQNQAAQVNSSSISFIRHLTFRFLPEISSPPSPSRSFPLSFWFALRPIRRLISSVLWEFLILTNS